MNSLSTRTWQGRTASDHFDCFIGVKSFKAGFPVGSRVFGQVDMERHEAHGAHFGAVLATDNASPRGVVFGVLHSSGSA